MITANSRYSDSLLVTVLHNGQDKQYITPSSANSYSFSYVFHVTDGSDRPDTLANAFYGDPSKWWVIADANPEIINWFNVPEGTIIRIPNS